MAPLVKYLCSLFILFSCQEPVEPLTLYSSNEIILKNGIYVYQDKPFTGTLHEASKPSQLKRITQFRDGKKHGKQIKYYPNGSIYSIRDYTEGEKSGTHTGFWNNGQKKFSYSFKNGVAHGTQYEWYENGKPLREQNYINGKEDGSQKAWRTTGKLSVNYLVKNNQVYGVVKSRLCYSVKNGKGVYK